MPDTYVLSNPPLATVDCEKKAPLRHAAFSDPARRSGLIGHLLGHVRISWRIYAVVWLSLFTIALAAGVYVHGEGRIRTAEARADSLRRITDHAKALELLTARMEMAQVALSGDPEAARADFARSRREALSHLNAIRNARIEAPGLAALGASYRALGDEFSAAAAARGRIGTGGSDGLRAQMAQGMAQVEDELTHWPNVGPVMAKLMELRRHERDLVTSGSAEASGHLRKALQELDFAIFATPFDPGTRTMLSGRIAAYGKSAAELAAMAAQRDDADDALRTGFREAFDHIAVLIKTADTALDEATLAGRAVREDTRMVMTAVVVAGSLVFMILALAIARSIHRPVTGIREAMNALAAGNPEVDIPGLTRGDEIGAMARAIAVFKRNAQEIQVIRNQERQRTIQAEASRRENLKRVIAAFEGTVRKVAAEVESSVDKIARTAGDLDRDTRRTRRNGAEMANAIAAAAESMTRVVRSSETLASANRTVGGRLQESELSIHRVLEKTRTLGKQAETLSSTAGDIDNVTRTITEIAASTQLLALNAGIEAARAGVAGKGFGVVASEIKILAQQTTLATADIAGEVDNIQQVISLAIAAIAAICREMETVENLTRDLSGAILTQGQAGAEIGQSVKIAAKGTDQVSSHLASVTGAIESAANSATAVLETVADLTGHSDRMAGEIDGFLAGIYDL